MNALPKVVIAVYACAVIGLLIWGVEQFLVPGVLGGRWGSFRTPEQEVAGEAASRVSVELSEARLNELLARTEGKLTKPRAAITPRGIAVSAALPVFGQPRVESVIVPEVHKERIRFRVTTTRLLGITVPFDLGGAAEGLFGGLTADLNANTVVEEVRLLDGLLVITGRAR